MSKIRWEPSRTSREEVFSAMILFLELLAREEKTQVVIIAQLETSRQYRHLSMI